MFNDYKNLLAKASTIILLMNELYEVEDEYLETWLMEGCPDGASLGEIIDYLAEEGTYEEWVILAYKLLKLREEDDCE